MTEKDIDAIAEEFERGVELPKVLYEYMGIDPASRNGEGDSSQLSVRLPRELLDAAQRRANEQERSVNDLAREALERFLSS